MTEKPFWENFQVIVKAKPFLLVKPQFTGANKTADEALWNTMLTAGNIDALADIDQDEWKTLSRSTENYAKYLKRVNISISTKKLLLVLMLSDNLDDALWNLVLDSDQDITNEDVLAMLGYQQRWLPIAEMLIT